ncbi:MAG TPA: class I SAM-dependent methyltransferase [Acidobacteriota bacterium]|nr:class I SAM-dependent methyltransferase [Acidobacteriota bacterium]
MVDSVEKIQSDFNRIAQLTENDPPHPILYQAFLLRQVPKNCAQVLDVGCGTGNFARLLATRAEQVTGIDLSPEMIRIAQAQQPVSENIEYHCGDFFEFPFETESFDCVVSLATLHHFELQSALTRMKTILKPGGRLIIQDLRADATLIERMLSLIALSVTASQNLWRTGRLRQKREIRAAWREHAQGERYLTMAEVGELCATLLPGAVCYRHLLWRYSLVWTRPSTDQ